MRNVQSTLCYKWFDEVWNKGDEDAIDRMMGEAATAKGIGGDTQPLGAAGFKTFFRDFRSQFHDINVEVEDVISEDDMEVARTNVTAVHTASGTPVNFNGMVMTKLADGKIIEAWNNYDFLTMYQQLGQKLV
jgi:predicted ester cyclase